MPRSLPPIHLTDSHDAELAQYRDLAGQAVVGLIFGLLSPAALIDPMLWIIPPLGVFFSVWALRRIRKNPAAMAGRKRATLGLALALLCVAAAPTDWLAYRYIIRAQAQQVADTWFKYLLENQPQNASVLMHIPPPKKGAPAQSHTVERDAMEPLPRTLLKLGPRAQAHFYQTSDQIHDENEDIVTLIYAVAYDAAGEQGTFYAAVQLCRRQTKSGEIQWEIFKTRILEG